MNRNVWLSIPATAVMLCVLLLLAVRPATADTNTTPTIDIWYGLTQNFGQNGIPQEWVNILGTASDPDGVAALTYQLNGATSGALNLGPDLRRLVDPGDFNIEIAHTSLLDGPNQLLIMATDTLSNTAVQTVTINYTAGQTWPKTYTLDWSTVATATDAVWIVDGKWQVLNGALRPMQLGYDRLFTVGDINEWTDYEVTVPITIHGLDPNAPFGPPGGGPGVGLLVRWQGHDQRFGEQPSIGWQRHGALGWHRWYKNQSDQLRGRLTMARNITDTINQAGGKSLDFGIAYNFKLRSVSPDSGAPYYHFRVWEVGQPEPVDWDFISRGDEISTNNGSVLLLAHYVDASFGNITVTPLTPGLPKVTANKTGQGQIMIEPPASAFPGGNYPYGTVITVTATAANGWTFGSWGGAFASKPSTFNVSLTEDVVIAATFKQDLSGLKSDDFNSCTLNTSVWSFVNPNPPGDGVSTPGGSQLLLTAPAGNEHNPWRNGNGAVRMMQAANNADFEIEVKFDSDFGDPIPIQGIMVEESDTSFLRFDFFKDDNGDYRAYAVAIVGQDVFPKNNRKLVDKTSPMHIRVRRTDNQWSHLYSLDGTNWLSAGSFEHTMSVSKVGVYGGNAPDDTGAVPEHTAIIDYFFNRTAPIAPEDPNPIVLTLPEETEKGSVEASPPANAITGYTCGEEVTITATPKSGYKLDAWGGALAGKSGNTVTYTVTEVGAINISATFAQVSNTVFLPFVSK